MGNNKKWLQLIILTAVLLIGGYTIADSMFSQQTVPQEGSEAPNFGLAGLDEQVYQLDEQRNHVVLLNFWGTWCDPCKREMPAIQKQYEKWKDKGVRVLAVNIGESAVTVRSFMEQHQLTFPVLFDPNESIRKKYGVVNYPTTFFIDRQGIIRVKKEGEMDEAFIDSTLSELLG
ncbi:thiol-disulfide oxidoreductase ResA [Paenibacillus thermoaerophilus]|uniref:Thiol-disulfide oxidoreductase ResA n=1 Tax=Paenibacillus thermoaerophilus TaxID=1215385 RepID=A0ABW2V5V4_9BACL|nr:thiol-disulfide oxidoreductase ResA [Paenibacillus thermoaerophilus]TMV07510.1 thiol-disulfide oxidoreductase ResA [Paenibacillus thermoaerophilus]